MKLGIDMGGTHTGLGLVDGLKIVKKTEFDTDISRGAEAYAKDLAVKIKEFLEASKVSVESLESIGMGVPGSANRENGLVEYANNLGFENVPFKALLTEALGKEVELDNDANLAALGEYLLSGSKAKSFMMVTLGTGIGGGIILNGEVYRGVNFAEGEIGHMTIKYDGIQCNCGRRGCFEAYASTNALVKMACDAMRSNTGSLLWQLSKIDGKTVFEAYKAGDATITHVIDEYTTLLAEGLTNLINIFQPEEMVIGGGISAVADLFLPATIEKVSKIVYSRESKKNTKITAAKFGNDAGIIGAANLK